MSTRHLSAENAYPFISEESLPVEAQGVVDLWFVVVGPPDGVTTEASSSSGAPSTGAGSPGTLIGVQAVGSVTTYTFRIEGPSSNGSYPYWDVTFEVPHTGIGVVKNISPSSVRAVLSYNANNVLKTGGGLLSLLVVPTRIVFYYEAVTAISFHNIFRCNGVESPNVVEDVTTLSPGNNLELGDGYNCDISDVDGVLTLAAANGNGLGNVPSVAFGDTEGCVESSSSSGIASADEVSLVRTVNGITPADGNLVVTTSRLVGKEKAEGRLTLILRRA